MSVIPRSNLAAPSSATWLVLFPPLNPNAKTFAAAILLVDGASTLLSGVGRTFPGCPATEADGTGTAAPMVGLGLY